MPHRYLYLLILAAGCASRSPVQHTAVPHVLTNSAPKYPAMLSGAGIEGDVVVSISIDSLGHTHPKQIREVTSAHVQFTQAIRLALAEWQFAPKPQVAQLTFSFRVLPLGEHGCPAAYSDSLVMPPTQFAYDPQAGRGLVRACRFPPLRPVISHSALRPRSNDSLEQTGRPAAVPQPELRPGRPAAQLRRYEGHEQHC